MSAILLTQAAGGPVIPTFGKGSSCVIQNHQFCLSWFVDNFGSRFQPRLLEHIELTAIAVGVGMVIAFAAALLALLDGHRASSARPVALTATMPAVSKRDLHNRPTAAELVAAVAEFLEGDVHENTSGAVNFHARVAANVLRTVERELLDDRSAPELLGFPDEASLAAAIRRGDLDERGAEVLPTLRGVVLHRLAVSHPGYDRV